MDQHACMWLCVVPFLTVADWFYWRTCSRFLHGIPSARYVRIKGAVCLRSRKMLSECALHSLTPYLRSLKVHYGCLNALMRCAHLFVRLHHLYILVPFFRDGQDAHSKLFLPATEWQLIVTIHHCFPFCKLTFLDNEHRRRRIVDEENEHFCDSIEFYWQSSTHLYVQGMRRKDPELVIAVSLADLCSSFPDLVSLTLNNVELPADSHPKLQTLRLVLVHMWDSYTLTKWTVPELQQVIVDCTCCFHGVGGNLFSCSSPASAMMLIPGALFRVEVNITQLLLRGDTGT